MQLKNYQLQSSLFDLEYLNKLKEREQQTSRPTRYIASITEKTQRTVQWLCIMGVLCTVGFVLTQFNGNIHSVFSIPVLLPSTLSFIAIFFLWQFITNSLRFKVYIRETPKIKQERLLQATGTQKVARYAFISTTLSLPFLVLNLLYIAIAWQSGTGSTVIHWDHFGELIFELPLFFGVGAVVLFLDYKLFKALKK